MSDPVSLVVINLYDEMSHHVWIEKSIRRMLEAQGDLVEGVDYDIVSGFIDDPKLRDTGEDASSKQLWFLGKCLAEAMKIQEPSAELAIAIDIARQEMRGAVSKSRASSLIDALKELSG